jgi:hypothetical protein
VRVVVEASFITLLDNLKTPVHPFMTRLLDKAANIPQTPANHLDTPFLFEGKSSQYSP